MPAEQFSVSVKSIRLLISFVNHFSLVITHESGEILPLHSVQGFGSCAQDDKTPSCHPERSEGSGLTDAEILSAAKDDSQDTTQVPSREVSSSNVCQACWFIEPELAVDWWTDRVLPGRGAWQSSREAIYRVHWERDGGGDARRHVP